MLAIVHFRHGGISMAPAILSVIAFPALMVWRFVFVGPHHWPLARGVAPRQHRRNSILEQGLHISDPGDVAVIAGNRFENSSDSLDPLDGQDRAKSYLRRIAALTCATQIDDAYILDVGNMRFHVGERYVTRLRDMTDPQCASEKTCFYSVHKGMPIEEEIATALLQLASNPGLFDKWAVRNELAIKADGQVFNGVW